MIFARPRLYEMMLNRIPSHKLSHGKKILRTEEEDNRIHLHFSDNTSYEADLLVGADGAYSTVRRSLYKHLDKQGLLPASDLEDFTLASINMVGVSEPKDLSKYPELKDDFCHFSIVVGGSGGRSVSEKKKSLCQLLLGLVQKKPILIKLTCCKSCVVVVVVVVSGALSVFLTIRSAGL